MAATNALNRSVQQQDPQQQDPASPSPSIVKMLGVLALAVGVGVVGYYALDGHCHTCEACGHRWRHLGAFNLGDPGAHSCDSCGTVQWWKDGTPHVFREALRMPPRNVMPDTIASRFRDVPRFAIGLGSAPPPKVPR